MTKNKLSSILVASLLAASQISVQAQTPAGAGTATNSAVGGVSNNVVIATAVGVAVIASLNSGGSGSLSAGNVAVSEGAKSSGAAATAAGNSNAAIQGGLTALASLIGNSSNQEVSSTYQNLLTALSESTAAAAAAAQAASDLSIASSFSIVGVVNGNRMICQAATSCTKAELTFLAFKAADAAAKAYVAVQTVNYYAGLIAEYLALEVPETFLTFYRSSLATAKENEEKLRVASDQAKADYELAKATLGTTGTTIATTTGTTGTTGTSGTTGTTGTY